MASTLKQHRIVETGWILEREISSEEPYGGVLADEPGLGKTIQMLAAMIHHKPGRKACKLGHGSTLIVVPSVLLRQWQREIELHCAKEHVGNVLVSKASALESATNKHGAMKILKNSDIM
jgi:SNF2 family DNA or RNA helicase